MVGLRPGIRVVNGEILTLDQSSFPLNLIIYFSILSSDIRHVPIPFGNSENLITFAALKSSAL